ncbi:hypothetical protein NADFUDRAFT_14197, partial [Nadsonia fulvescens var. elongata DSM 6958]
LKIKDVLDGKFYSSYAHFEWIGASSVGMNTAAGIDILTPTDSYLTRHPLYGYYEIKSITDESFNLNLTQSHSFVYNHTQYPISSFLPRPGPNLTHAILTTNSTPLWRHSSLAQYWLLDLNTGLTEPLTQPENRAYLAEWSHGGEKVAMVIDNNVFVYSLDSKVKTQITPDGSRDNNDLLYGRPNWVYEEEILQTNKALWWSPDDTHLALLKTNDSQVFSYPLTFYVPSSDGTNAYDPAYPSVIDLKYPKPGFFNPVVDVMMYSFEENELFLLKPSEETNHENDLVMEIKWMGSDNLLIKYTDRYSDLLYVDLGHISSRSRNNVRSFNVKDLDGGYVEVTRDTLYVAPTDSTEEGYIDTIIVDGYNHLAYFSPLSALEPSQILTHGEWEVVSKVGVDTETRLVYFVSTKKSSLERHLYSVSIDSSATTTRNLTNISLEGFYENIKLDSSYKHALITYAGPDIPYQMVIKLESGNVLRKFDTMNQPPISLTQYDMPLKIYQTIPLTDDFMANALEIRPPNFDTNRKYPVLFYVYGGPQSQKVNKRFEVDFQSVVAGSLDTIVVIVDGRGTGFRGRSYRTAIRDKLGGLEASDQITAAKIWAKKPYVDSSRISIWGWSFGGFVTLKVLETDGGATFQYGMAVAPVTDWRFYDSIFTERYMHDPTTNREGYDRARISNVASLANNTRFLIMHGTGDDNVHIQNTLSLLDKLNMGKVENYDLMIFPDSDHNIYHHNANYIVYDKLFSWIKSSFD